MNTLIYRQSLYTWSVLLDVLVLSPFTVLKREFLPDDTGACLQRNISQHSVLTTTTQNTYSSMVKKLQWIKTYGGKQVSHIVEEIITVQISCQWVFQAGEGFQSYSPFILYNVNNMIRYLEVKQGINKCMGIFHTYQIEVHLLMKWHDFHRLL